MMLVLWISMAAGGLAEQSGISLEGRDYLHRWSQGDQHEFTPVGQEDLKSWKDMVTVVLYPDANTGEDLAELANSLLGLYQQHGGRVLRTDSVPRTEEKEAEHLIVVALPQKEFVEIAFPRLAMFESSGLSIVYSRRLYGSSAGNEASAWLQANGQKTEEALMQLSLTDALAAVGERGEDEA